VTHAQYEVLSNQAVAACAVVYFLAVLAHLAEWAFGRRVDEPVTAQTEVSVGAGGSASDTASSAAATTDAAPDESERMEMFGRIGVSLRHVVTDPCPNGEEGSVGSVSRRVERGSQSLFVRENLDLALDDAAIAHLLFFAEIISQPAVQLLEERMPFGEHGPVLAIFAQTGNHLEIVFEKLRNAFEVSFDEIHRLGNPGLIGNPYRGLEDLQVERESAVDAQSFQVRLALPQS